MFAALGKMTIPHAQPWWGDKYRLIVDGEVPAHAALDSTATYVNFTVANKTKATLPVTFSENQAPSGGGGGVFLMATDRHSRHGDDALRRRQRGALRRYVGNRHRRAVARDRRPSSPRASHCGQRKCDGLAALGRVPRLLRSAGPLE
jgi:predicted outer membrane repeat protein